jgi:hypothetical protein
MEFKVSDNYNPFNNVGVNSTSIRISKMDLPIWARCVLGVVGGYFSIETLVNDYIKLFTSTSAEWSTIWPVVSNTLRRYAGWALLGVVAIDIVNTCFD